MLRISPSLLTLAIVLPLLTATVVHPQSTDDSVDRAGESAGAAAAQDFLSVPEMADYHRIGVIVRSGEGAEAVARQFRETLIADGRTIPEFADVRRATEAVGDIWGSDRPINARDITVITEELHLEALVTVSTVPVVMDDRVTKLNAHLNLDAASESGNPWSVDVEVDVPQPQPRESYWKQHPFIVWGAIIAAVALWLLSLAIRQRHR